MRRIIQPDLLRTLFRYVFVGGLGAIADWTIFAGLVYLADWHYLFAGTLSFVLATLLNYGLGLAWAFQGGRHVRHLEILYVYLASLVGLLINLSVLFLLYEWAQFHLLLSKVLASGFAFLWNFSARYFWIFGRRQLA
jgi:putative flippase GtrA